MAATQAIPEELRTVRDFVRWGVSRFAEGGLYFGHGTDNALDEAYALVLHALHLPHALPATYLETSLTENERQAVHELLCRRLEERMPAPYLIREAWFSGRSFYVDERVLVPRSPIAELIESHFSPFIEPARVRRILDIGTGSACIAITCAYAFPNARVDAIDISAAALDVAGINIKRHHMESRVYPILSDVYEALHEQRYDVIVSNPPYVQRSEMSTLPEEYLHEPEFALEAGEDGLEVVRRILAAAPDHLEEDGILVVEVGNAALSLTDTFPEVPFLWLEFERGGSGVFLLTYDQVHQHRASFAGAL